MKLRNLLHLFFVFFIFVASSGLATPPSIDKIRARAISVSGFLSLFTDSVDTNVRGYPLLLQEANHTFLSSAVQTETDADMAKVADVASSLSRGIGRFNRQAAFHLLKLQRAYWTREVAIDKMNDTLAHPLSSIPREELELMRPTVFELESYFDFIENSESAIEVQETEALLANYFKLHDATLRFYPSPVELQTLIRILIRLDIRKKSETLDWVPKKHLREISKTPIAYALRALLKDPVCARIIKRRIDALIEEKERLQESKLSSKASIAPPTTAPPRRRNSAVSQSKDKETSSETDPLEPSITLLKSAAQSSTSEVGNRWRIADTEIRQRLWILDVPQNARQFQSPEVAQLLLLILQTQNLGIAHAASHVLGDIDITADIVKKLQLVVFFKSWFAAKRDRESEKNIIEYLIPALARTSEGLLELISLSGNSRLTKEVAVFFATAPLTKNLSAEETQIVGDAVLQAIADDTAGIAVAMRAYYQNWLITSPCAEQTKSSALMGGEPI